MKPGRWLFFSSAMASWMLREPCFCVVDGRYEWLRSGTGLALEHGDANWGFSRSVQVEESDVVGRTGFTWKRRVRPTDGALPGCLLAPALSEVLPNRCPSQAVWD